MGWKAWLPRRPDIHRVVEVVNRASLPIPNKIQLGKRREKVESKQQETVLILSSLLPDGLLICLG